MRLWTWKERKMNNLHIYVSYDSEKEEAVISDTMHSKRYNRIVTEGDIGTALKDFCIGVKEGE